MKIFYFVYWHDKRFKEKVGGPVKVFELCDNLKKLGHDVFLFIPDIGFPEKQTKARVFAVPLLDLPVIRFLSFQILSQFKALTIIASTGKPAFFLVRIMWSFAPHLLAKLLQIPIFLEINDSPFRAYAMTASPLKRNLIHCIDRITYRLSDHLFPVTQKIANDLHQQEGVPVGNITVLPSGTNTDLFRPLDRKACCKELGLPEGFLYIGFVGTFFRYQGIDALIACAPDLIAKNQKVRFLMVGDGPMRSEWETLIHTAQLDDYFILTGFLPYNRVPVYCGVMDICVAPLRTEAGESSAVKIFDYLACGKPVVMSDIGGSADPFLKSGAALAFPAENSEALADALASLIENEGLRVAMGDKGREFILSGFSRTKIALKVEEIALTFTNPEGT